MGKVRWNTETVKQLVESNEGYKFIGEYIPKTNSRIDILHENCGEISNIQLRHFKNGTRCMVCNPYKKKTMSVFLSECNEKRNDMDEYVFLDEYINDNTNLKIKHNICNHLYSIKPYNFLIGKSCPKCAKCIKRTTDSFKDELEKLHKGIFDKIEIIGSYKTNITPILIKCKKCNLEFNRIPTNMIYKNVYYCPVCEKHDPRMSKGVVKICEILENNNIEYQLEKRFEDCRNVKPLPFDFYIPKLNLCIEYDGQQHFMPIDSWGGNEAFKLTKHNDSIKTEYCSKNNINLCRIKFDEDITSIILKLLS